MGRKQLPIVDLKEAIINTINKDLANSIGIIVARTAAMVDKYLDGYLPALTHCIDKELDKPVHEVIRLIRASAGPN